MEMGQVFYGNPIPCPRPVGGWAKQKTTKNKTNPQAHCNKKKLNHTVFIEKPINVSDILVRKLCRR